MPEVSQTSPPLVVRGESRKERSARLGSAEISVLVLMLASIAVSQAFPFRPVKFGLMAVLGVVALVQTLRRPAMGLALLVFVTPAMDVMPVTFGIRGLNAETLLVIFAVAIWLRANQMYGRDHFSSPLGRVLLLYAILVLGSAGNATLIWNVSLFDVLASAKNHLSFMIFLPVAFHVARDRRDQGLLVAAASLSLFVNALQAVNHSWLAFFAGSLERHRAMALLALQPNTLGAALAMYLPLCILFTTNRISNRAVQLWFVAVTAASGFALLLTLSRGSWLGLVAGLCAVALLGDRKLILVLAIAAASYTVWVPQAAIDRVEVTTQIDDDGADGAVVEGSAQMRLEQYKSLWPMMAPRPVLGWGYDSYPRVFERYGTLQRAKGAHSSYVQLGTEGGAVGLAGLVLVLLATMWAGWRAFRLCESPFHRWLGMGVLGGMLSMAVSMITGARFEPQKIFVFFWVFAGIAQRETVLVLMRRAAGRRVVAPAAGPADEAAAEDAR